MSKKELRYYITPKGNAPFVDWLNQFKDYTVRARIERRLERIELGNYGDYKSVGEGVFECRFDFGSGYRVYFAEQGDQIVILLCAGDKSTQKKDINTAKHYWKELQHE